MYVCVCPSTVELAIKRNEIGSFGDTCMDLEIVINEVSQKEKNKYHLLMYISGIQKNGIDDLICKTETQKYRTNAWTPKGKGRGWDELGLTYIHSPNTMYKINN